MCCSHSHGRVLHEPEALTFPEDESLSCQCGAGWCCGALTGDDRLCDRCRVNCEADNRAVSS